MGAAVLCMGEALVQLTPPVGVRLADAGDLHTSLGGAEANVSVTLAGLGIDTAWAGYLGADPLGDGLERQLQSAGVDTSLVVRRDDAPTGVYFKDPSPDGSRPYYYRSGSAASLMNAATAQSWAATVSPRVVHVGGIAPLLSASAESFSRAVIVDRAFSTAMVSFDVNHRVALSTSGTPSLLADLATAADIVFVGLDEAERLWGTRTSEEVREQLGDAGVLIVKDGKREAVAFADGLRVAIPAQRVDVVEPTGAGDAFAAGWLSSWLDDTSTTSIEPKEALRRALGAGHTLAALALRTPHDIPKLPSSVFQESARRVGVDTRNQ